MSNDIVDTSVPIEWIEDGDYWECPLIGQRWAKFAGLVARTEEGLSKVDDNLYQLERHHSGEFRIRWMGEANPRPEHAYAQVVAKPKPPGTFLGVPMPIVTPFAAALATAVPAAVALFFQFGSLPDGALSANDAQELQKKLKAKRDEVITLEGQLETIADSLSAVQVKFGRVSEKLAVYADREKVLHQIFLDDPEMAKLSYVLGISHAYRIEVIKRLTGDQAQLKSMLTGIEEDYIRDTFAELNHSNAFTKGKAIGIEEAGKVFGLGETPVLGGQDVLNSLGGR